MGFKDLFNRFTARQFFKYQLHCYTGADDDRLTHHYFGIRNDSWSVHRQPLKMNREHVGTLKREHVSTWERGNVGTWARGNVGT